MAHESEIRDQLARAGIALPLAHHVICDGTIQRYRIAPSRKANGWYSIIERNGFYYGTAGDWKSGVKVRLGQIRTEMRAPLAVQFDERKRSANKAAAHAAMVWEQAEVVEPIPDTYLDRKQVGAFGVRFNCTQVLVPLNDEEGGIHGLQSIDPNGLKLFSAGCSVSGHFFMIERTIETIGPAPLIICEGYATAASIHMATGLAVAVAFNCGNLLPVAKVLHKHWRPLLIAGDNDRATRCPLHKVTRTDALDPEYRKPDGCLCNPGKRAAILAAQATSGKWVVPQDCAGTDFNDLHREKGLIEVAGQIYDAL